jgi:hypothetical protein
MIKFSFIGYFTLVLRDFFPSPVVRNLPHVLIPQVLSLCYAIPASLLLYFLRPSLFSSDPPPGDTIVAIILSLIFGPWILNLLIKFVSSHLENFKLQMLMEIPPPSPTTTASWMVLLTTNPNTSGPNISLFSRKQLETRFHCPFSLMAVRVATERGLKGARMVDLR